jgi:hypothetical protein
MTKEGPLWGKVKSVLNEELQIMFQLNDNK